MKNYLRGEGVEPLYILDRTITRLIQAFSQMLQRKFGFSLGGQKLLLIVVFSLVANVLDCFSKLEFKVNNVFIGIGIWFVFLTIIWILGEVLAPFILYNLHKFFDPEGAFSQDKLYESGYSAWGWLIVGGSSIALAYLLPDTGISLVFFALGSITLLIDAYTAFVSRKRGEGRKKRGVATQALLDLLERCKGWLPIPHPLGA